MGDLSLLRPRCPRLVLPLKAAPEWLAGRFDAVIRRAPEFRVTDPLRLPHLSLGSDGKVPFASGWHDPFWRCLRWMGTQALLHVLCEMVTKHAIWLFTEDVASSLADVKVVVCPDAVVVRRAGASAVSTLHRDQAMGTVPASSVELGGFVNCSLETQVIRLIPRSHCLPSGERRLNPPDGFVREEAKASSGQETATLRVQVPPGHLVCFFAAILHHSFTPHPFQVHRVFLGFQLAPSWKSSHWPFGQDPDLLRLEEQSVMGLKSGHVPTFTTKLRILVDQRKRLAVEWAGTLNLIPEVREVLKRAQEAGWKALWGVDGATSPSLKELGCEFEPYSARDAKLFEGYPLGELLELMDEYQHREAESVVPYRGEQGRKEGRER